MIRKIGLLFNTVRFLKPVQFYWRLYLKVARFLPFSELIREPVRVRQIELIPPINKHRCYSNEQFCFLNEARSAILPIDWNNAQASKLWLYNLHYFDYLNQAQIDPQFAYELMRYWIKRNPVATGNGWEPYTLSLRIVNWIKYLANTNLAQEQCAPLYSSLVLQCRFLFQHLEYHLLGNHLFKNGVALIFAGVFIDSKEAQNWLSKGRQIIAQQTREQVLADGGHFERSPMYHELILEDILDCLNLHQSVACFSMSEAELMTAKSADMLSFLADILHQDGEIPFFNDSALLIAPSPESLFNYADRLGVKFINSTLNTKGSGEPSCIAKADSGLLVLQNKSAKIIFDVGDIGPDHLPGHAHCDSLSYELSLSGLRCIVNSGTYQYAGAERNHFRATEAHNTVKIDGVEQHEVWSIFRVARRGYPFDVSVNKQTADLIECNASLSGFTPTQAVHKRCVSLQKDQLLVNDVIQGKGKHHAESFVHFHPEVEIVKRADNILFCQRGDVRFSIHVLGGEVIDLEKGYYSSEFGLKTEASVLVMRKQAASPFSFGYEINF